MSSYVKSLFHAVVKAEINEPILVQIKKREAYAIGPDPAEFSHL